MNEDTFYIYGPNIEAAAQRLGLYVDRSHIIQLPDGNEGIVVEMTVGDVAFTPRVQEPEQAKMDRAFAEIIGASENDAFLDERARIAERLALGQDPLDG